MSKKYSTLSVKSNKKVRVYKHENEYLIRYIDGRVDLYILHNDKMMRFPHQVLDNIKHIPSRFTECNHIESIKILLLLK